MTEAKVWTLAMVMGVLLAIMCAGLHQWLGVVAALYSVLNAWAARYFLVCLKPSSKTE